jgi:hypothetical protein
MNAEYLPFAVVRCAAAQEPRKGEVRARFARRDDAVAWLDERVRGGGNAEWYAIDTSVRNGKVFHTRKEASWTGTTPPPAPA